jgi:hypothetical protein
MRRGWFAVVLLAALAVLPQTAWAQGSKGVDGTVWTKLNADNKALFTLGYFTGIQIFAKFAPGPCSGCVAECMDESSAKLVPVGTAIPQVVQVIDSIYQDPVNEAIPVQWALKLAAQKAKGVSDEEFKAALAEARQGSASATPGAPPAAPQPAPAPKP